MNFIKPFLTLVILVFCQINVLHASVYKLPDENSRKIGEPVYHTVKQGEYFQKIAEYYNVGLLALIEANPAIDPFLPSPGQELNIPKEMILPYGKREGIVINLPELRLYYFPPNEKIVYVFPVGIGRQGLSTPRTTSVIGDKRKDPTWRPTADMRERYFKEHGKELAAVVPAGPNNPFGKYALRIGTSEYLIHGSNQRVGIGLRASSGCIRLYDHDIEWLFNNVKVGTSVKIIDQSIKMAYEKDGKFLEVHQPLSRDEEEQGLMMTSALEKFIAGDKQRLDKVNELLAKPTGLVSAL